MCPRSIAGVPFDSVRRFWACLLLHTTCVHLCRNWVANCVVAWQTKYQKKPAYANVYVQTTFNQHPCVRGPLRECCSIQSGASGLPCYTTCVHLCCNWVATCVVVNQTKTQKPIQGPGRMAHVPRPQADMGDSVSRFRCSWCSTLINYDSCFPLAWTILLPIVISNLDSGITAKYSKQFSSFCLMQVSFRFFFVRCSEIRIRTNIRTRKFHHFEYFSWKLTHHSYLNDHLCRVWDEIPTTILQSWFATIPLYMPAIVYALSQCERIGPAFLFLKICIIFRLFPIPPKGLEITSFSRAVFVSMKRFRMPVNFAKVFLFRFEPDKKWQLCYFQNLLVSHL